MSQETFVLVKDLNFNDANVQAKAGDVLVFTPPEKLVIYRAGDIIGRIGFHKVSLDGLVLSGILLTEKKAAALKTSPVVAETPVIETPKTEAKAPAIEEKPEAGEQQAKAPEPAAEKTEEPKAPEVKEPEKAPEVKADKPAAKPAAKATEPAKKPKK